MKNKRTHAKTRKNNNNNTETTTSNNKEIMKKEGKKGETGSNEQKDREHIKNRKANNKDT